MARRVDRLSAQRGVALIFVLTTLTIVAAVAADFQYESRVGYRIAVNSRDELQALYNATSALRLRALLLHQQQKIELAVRGLLASFGLPANQRPPIAQIMQLVPVDCGFLAGLVRLKDGGRIDDYAEDDREDGQVINDVFFGDCRADIQSEHSKISVNVLRNRLNQYSNKVTAILLGYLMDPSMERHFEEDDANGQHAENAEELVAAITDYTDDDEERTGGSADEDGLYDNLDDRYKAKNAPFDSMAELQLIYGVDDELYELFRDRLTIYTNDVAIDLATAPMDQIMFGLLSCTLDGGDFGMLLGNPAMEQFLLELSYMRAPGMMFQVLRVADLKALLAGHGMAQLFDDACLGQTFTDKSGSTWFTINAVGSAGNVERRIRAVMQAQEGKLYYYREE